MSVSRYHTCLSCVRSDHNNDVCSDCGRPMVDGFLCKCESAVCARGADACLDCLAASVRADASELDTMHEGLREEVLAHMHGQEEPSAPVYVPGFLTRRQAG